MNKIGFILAAILLSRSLTGANAQTYTPGQMVNKDYGSFAKTFLADHCLDCHGESEPEGNLSLHDLGPVDEVNAGIWRNIWSQVTLKEMPPPDAASLEVVERLQFSDWIVGELSRVLRDKGGFHEHLDPHKGNFVDHALLFNPLPDGIELVPTSSPARLWRVTPEEHITRLNELINTEPEFDPAKPGLRTHGDAVPTNHGGELKLYFGTDNILEWQGGTVAYATAVKSIPAILSSSRSHGLDKYADFYTVNSAEATQIMAAAADLIRYMAYGPLSIVGVPEQITDDPKSYPMEGDIRGLPTSIVYSTKILRPLTPIYDLMKAEGVSDERLRAAVEYLFEALTFRPPSKKETDEYLAIVNQAIEKLGKEDGAVLGLSAIFLDRDALFRAELCDSGKPDQHGRVMLQDWELGLAVNHALRFIKPDEVLRTAIIEGRMRTKADVKREVERMLADESIRKPRILRFFRDYFSYDLGGYICKDTKALAATGVGTRFAQHHYRAMFDATASTDRLIELILQEDKDVLKQLLTTDKVVAYPADNLYFGRERTKAEREASAVEAKKAAEERAKLEEVEIAALLQEVAGLESQLKANPEEKGTEKELERTKKTLEAAQKKASTAKGRSSTDDPSVAEASFSGPEIFARASRRSFGEHKNFNNGSMKPERVLATAPEGERLGILTHPSWLVSHSDAMDNHAIHRGRWIRERLLGGGIPDVPITVDAMLPDEPHNSLRERMRVTREEYCWTCHQKMDPLGLPFEMYNHAGLFRTTELDEPVNTTGEIIDSGDPSLDGPVKDAIDMIQKLADSERAEQVFVRYAFRFWMGRNETLNDAPVLQEAYRAYKDGGGSMNALLTALLTSDAFLYRSRSTSDAHGTSLNAHANNWPQAAGPNANWQVEGKAPVHWSVAHNKNIKWRTKLPEGGQSSVTIWNDKAFLTTHKPLQSSSEIGSVSDIVGYCLDLSSGEILWTVELPGSIPVGTAGVFSDATVFAPVTDGTHVWFFNRSGSIGCYSMDGKRVWLREYTPRNRHTNRQAEPILFNNQLLVVEVLDKEAAKKLKRHAGVPEGIDPKSVWTYIHGLDVLTGDVLWVEPLGTVIHNTPMIGQRANGEWAVLHARGGPHGPLETPYGLTLTSLAPGKEGTPLWSKEIPRINPMLNNHWDAQRTYALDADYHVILDTDTGRELSRQNIRTKVDIWSYVPGSDSRKLMQGVDLPGKMPRLNTYHTNIVVRDWHYFLAHERNAIGRVNLGSGKVEYLDVPYQLAVSNDGTRTQIWELADAIPTIAENSRGIQLVNDKRSSGTGWGHVAAASPILVGQYLYFPVMTGTVYVIDTSAPEFSEKALVAINDLGPARETWTLSSFSYADKKLYIRTLKEVICIGD